MLESTKAAVCLVERRQKSKINYGPRLRTVKSSIQYQALCAKQVMFAEIGEISEKRLGSFWKNLLDNLPPERHIGKDDDLQELLDDTNRLYNYFSSDSTSKIDFAEEIEPYWAAVRLPDESEKPEEDNEDEEPEEESEPWADFYEKSAPAEKSTSGGYYQFCKVQFKDGGSPYAYLTGGLPLAVGDFVVVPVGNRNAEKTGRVTDVFVCSAQDAPYPPEKAKFVLRKSEQTAFTFTEKKVPPIEPAKNEKAAAPMLPVPVELPAVQTVPEEPASFEVEPVPEDPTFTLPPLPEQDEPKKPKRRIPWGWLAAGVAAAAHENCRGEPSDGHCTAGCRAGETRAGRTAGRAGPSGGRSCRAASAQGKTGQDRSTSKRRSALSGNAV